MGQSLSLPPTPTQVEQLQTWGARFSSNTDALPSHIPPYDTSILNLGQVSDDRPCTWHIQGGRLRFPLPANYSATCKAYGGQYARLSVEYIDSNPQFIVQTDSGGEKFVGTTPTAPFAKWGIYLQRAEIVNGMEAFGFADERVQSLLRHMGQSTGKVDALVAQLMENTPVGDWAKKPPKTLPTPIQQRPTLHPKSLTDSLVEELSRGMTNVSELKPLSTTTTKIPPCPSLPAAVAAAVGASVQRAPSLAPSLQNWLSLPPSVQAAAIDTTPATETPFANPVISSSPTGRGTPTATATSTEPLSPQNHIGVGKLPPRGHTPQLKHGTHTVGHATTHLQPSPEAHAAALVSRPGSRSRRSRSGSLGEGGSVGGRTSGRGWTAFTAFGLEVRDSIKHAHPHLSATEIEKLVGREWSSLGSTEKQYYAHVAAEVRRSSSQQIPATEDMMGTTGMTGRMMIQQQSPDLDGEGGRVGILGDRTGSDAATQGTQQQHEGLITPAGNTCADHHKVAFNATQSRRLRTHRTRRTYGPEFDTSDAPIPYVMEHEQGPAPVLLQKTPLDEVYEDILACEDHLRALSPPNLALKQQPRGKKRKPSSEQRQQQGKRRSGFATSSRIVEEDAEAEADVLGVLVEMRASALASSDQSDDDSGDGVGDGGTMDFRDNGDADAEDDARDEASEKKKSGSDDGKESVEHEEVTSGGE